MTRSKAYVCIDATGAIAGGCIVVDEAKSRHAIRTWLRLRPGCRVEPVALQDAYRLTRSGSGRRATSTLRAGTSAQAALQR